MQPHFLLFSGTCGVIRWIRTVGFSRKIARPGYRGDLEFGREGMQVWVFAQDRSLGGL